MSVEQTVVAEVEKVAGEVKAAAEAVVEKAEAVVEEKAVAVEKAAKVDISTEEKLFLREAELEYLKATMDIQRLTKITEEKSKSYSAYIEGLLKKYALTKAEYAFDATVNAFKKL